MNSDPVTADSTIYPSDRNGPRPPVRHGTDGQKARFSEIDQGVADAILSEDVSHPVDSVPFTDAPEIKLHLCFREFHHRWRDEP